MDIFCDYEGNLYFNELFFYFLKNSMYDKIYEVGDAIDL